ncbi:PAS domain-containing protein [Chondromyces crocatus]|uniref:Anti-anti sigma factor protein n=1 Tax=Chondromyces crocatus TaxID=52 RepID=A0A0K1EQE0_CHOCO|nr:PAS domain-containing protein [Chondromyces crocatus]AKT43130.1 anti-anti sigma factor protein [Chondromyces crocatus]
MSQRDPSPQGPPHAVAARQKQLDEGWAHFFEATSDLLICADPAGVSLDLSASWERTLGFTLDEIRAHPLSHYVHPADREHTLAEFTRLNAGGTFIPFTNRYRRKDGTYASIAWKSYVQVQGLAYCLAHDVSATEEAEAALRTSHERLQHLLHASGVVLYAFSLDEGRPMTFISENVREQFGYAAEDFIRDPRFWHDRIHPDDREGTLAAGEQLSRGGAYHREYRWLHKDGSYRWIHDEARLGRAAEGGPPEAYGSLHDITERKESERTIQQQATTLLELSTPLIPISDEILVMPLIGVVDSRRAEQVMTTLLEGIGERRVHWVILDITGVGVIDTLVADALLRTARAARLLGVDVALTGIRPDVASTLVTLDVDMSHLLTFGTLQAGIQHAMRCAARPPAR